MKGRTSISPCGPNTTTATMPTSAASGAPTPKNDETACKGVWLWYVVKIHGLRTSQARKEPPGAHRIPAASALMRLSPERSLTCNTDTQIVGRCTVGVSSKFSHQRRTFNARWQTRHAMETSRCSCRRRPHSRSAEACHNYMQQVSSVCEKRELHD